MRLLENKVAVITGAASGMGKATAKLFAAEGARVVVGDLKEEEGRQTVEEIKKDGGTAVFAGVDVADAAQVQAMIELAVKEYGGLDVLFNNAGIALFGRDGKIADVDEKIWDRVLAVNLKGVYLGMKYAIPRMIERGGGSIINNASIAGLVGFPALAAYCASKGGIIQLTKAAALDYGPQKIRVNAICPGVIRTAMTKDLLESEPQEEQMEGATPLGRLGEAEDIARAALFLASENSGFVTGVALPVDGGWTAQ